LEGDFANTRAPISDARLRLKLRGGEKINPGWRNKHRFSKPEQTGERVDAGEKVKEKREEKETREQRRKNIGEGREKG